MLKFSAISTFLNSNTCDISVSKLQPISVGHVALGLSNGDLELYCRTKSEHVTLLWTKVRPYDILHTCAHSVFKNYRHIFAFSFFRVCSRPVKFERFEYLKMRPTLALVEAQVN